MEWKVGRTASAFLRLCSGSVGRELQTTAKCCRRRKKAAVRVVAPPPPPPHHQLSRRKNADEASLSMARPRLPVPPLKGHSLSDFVQFQTKLRRLADLGVNLYEIGNEKKGAGQALLNASWSEDLAPRLGFLLGRCRLQVDQLGQILTKNPWILTQSLPSLEKRVSYLKAKGFSIIAIHHLVVTCPKLLNEPVTDLDEKLRWLQSELHLTEDQVRTTIVKCPDVIQSEWTANFRHRKTRLVEEFGFLPVQTKEIFLKEPRIWLADQSLIESNFNYVHEVLGLSQQRISLEPNCLMADHGFLKGRHRFLQRLKRAQFDPEQANYVSLSLLIDSDDRRFCNLAAKCPIGMYNWFLKSQ